MSPNARGALFMMGSMTAFTVNDALMKGLSGIVPLSQAVFLRGCLTTVLMLGLALSLGQLRLRMSRRDRLLIALRTVTEVATAYFFITALFNMPLANASAIMQALPLTVTLAGAVFLGQAVGWRRWAAIAVGFLGVMLIVRPGMAGFTIYSLYVLAAVILVTIRDILSRKISDDVPSLVIALKNAIWVTVAFGIASIGTEWAPITAATAGPIIGAAVTIIAAYFCAVAAMRHGDIAVVAPFRYTSLVVAMLLGVIVFAERPDGLTLLGAGIVVATGIYTFYRERANARDRQRQ